MKLVVFETVINGTKYTFSVRHWLGSAWTCWAGIDHTNKGSVTSDVSEEDAILKLVKLLEKDK